MPTTQTPRARAMWTTLLLALMLLLTPNLQAQGGFPVPGGAADPLAEEQGWLGVALEQIDAKKAGTQGHKTPMVLVTQVFEGSPAHSSGFEVGDIILNFGTTSITDIPTLVGLVKATPPGSRVTFKRLRDGKSEEVNLLLGIRPSAYGMLRTQFMDKPAPPFALTSVDGSSELKLEDFKGKVVLLDFWATWCGPCRMTLPEVQKLHEKFESQGLVVIGVTDETKRKVKPFLKKHRSTYLQSLDPKGETNARYSINALPTMFLIDRKGVVRELFIGAGDMGVVEDSIMKLLKE